MLPETASTDELRRLTGLSKSGITTFEQQGIIRRSAVNAWPMPDTLVALVTHLRTRKPASSDDRSRWEKARAEREELRNRREARELVKFSDFREAWDEVNGQMLMRLDALPARVTRDLALRRKWQEEIRQLRNEVADYFRKRAAELGGDEAA
jgi:phage terminase Nu1 subunit (DNA packaging protein)